MLARRRRAENAQTGRAEIYTRFAEMRKGRECVRLVGGSYGDDVWCVEARREMRNEVVVCLQGAVINVACGSNEQDARVVQTNHCVEKRLCELVATKTRIDDANICALRTSLRVPELAHALGISAGTNRVRGVAAAEVVEKLQ